MPPDSIACGPEGDANSHFALALCGLLLGIWGLFARADRVTQTLAAGIIVTLAAGAFGTHMAPIQGAHEIAIVLPFSAVLAGRLIGPWLAAKRPATSQPMTPRRASRLARIAAA